MNYIIPTGKIDHSISVNGNLMTGDTYNVKDIIKQYFGGKWDAERKGWIIDPNSITRWMNIKIKPAIATTVQNKTAYNPANWRNADGSLSDDF